MATYGMFQMCLDLARKILSVLPKIFEMLAGFSGGLFSQLLLLAGVWLSINFIIAAIEKILTAGAWLMKKFE